MKLLRKIIKYFFLVLLIAIVALSWVKIRSLPFESKKPLKVKWEGLVKEKNYRDVGASINQCYGKKVLKPGYLLRSNGWFSGWSCDEVGNPDVIFSLNYSPEKSENYFCWDSIQDAPNIGVFLNPDIQLHDLEFLKTWQNEKMRRASCDFFKEIINQINHDRKSLIHCDAGRDRTGFYSAVFAAIAAEQQNILNEKMLNAIECDYRKTESLVPKKYGRMKQFLQAVTAKSSLIEFLSNQCQIPETEFQAVALKLSY